MHKLFLYLVKWQFVARLVREELWAYLDSNQGPRRYEHPALTAELQAQFLDYISNPNRSDIIRPVIKFANESLVHQLDFVNNVGVIV